MRPGAQFGLLMMVGLSMALGACAAAPPKPEVTAPAAPPIAPAPAAPLPTIVKPEAPPSPLEGLVAPHRQKAEALERDGHLRRALEEWKIALTIDPEDSTAREGRKKLEGQIERAISDRIQQGREALGRGAHLEARRHFLAALALDPANKVAFEALRTEVKEIRFLTHTVRRGETLATIAERYYGDRSRSEVIWETNQLPPNPKLVAGLTLKIPEIPGVPFVHPEARQERQRQDAPAQEAGRPTIPKEETTEVHPTLHHAKEALEKREYAVALADVEKFLADNPRHADGLDLKKAVLYQQGKAQYDQKKYEDSYRTLTQLAKLAPNYQDSASLLRQARVGLIQEHYNEGIRLYREEKLEEAIAQWRTVLVYDPDHANAKKNIEQAERLLRGLQQQQKQ